MLASQLCVSGNKTDLNWKWVQKLKVWLHCSISLFCEDFDVMLCLNLMKMHAKWKYHDLGTGIRTIKTFTKHKKCYC